MGEQDVGHGLPQSMGILVEETAGRGILGRSLKTLAESRRILGHIHAVCHGLPIGRLKGSRTRIPIVIGRVEGKRSPKLGEIKEKCSSGAEDVKGKQSLGPRGGRAMATRTEEIVPGRKGWRLSKAVPLAAGPAREEAAAGFAFWCVGRRTARSGGSSLECAGKQLERSDCVLAEPFQHSPNASSSFREGLPLFDLPGRPPPSSTFREGLPLCFPSHEGVVERVSADVGRGTRGEPRDWWVRDAVPCGGFQGSGPLLCFCIFALLLFFIFYFTYLFILLVSRITATFTAHLLSEMLNSPRVVFQNVFLFPVRDWIENWLWYKTRLRRLYF